MKSEFTLLIPTHNRHENLFYSMKYYANCGFNVIYIDSSKYKYAFNNKIPENISYVYLKDKNFIEKLLFVIKDLKVKYIVLCADDDFLVIDNVLNGVNILNDKQNIQCYRGAVYSFNPKFKDKIYPLTLDSEIGYGSSTNDLKSFFENYSIILWGLFRKESLLQALKILNSNEYSNDNFIELVIGTIMILEGGIYFAKSPWLIREVEQTNNWGQRHKKIDDITNDISLQNDVAVFKKAIYDIYKKDYFKITIDSYLKGSKKNRSILKRLKMYVLKRYSLVLIDKKIINPIIDIYKEKFYND